ncbi:hypothetical protein NIES2101_31120 [Calothrix sp. HK-06]|nr:hypothetical protein NIES2101_31120 [Calothrix sp. HK-06]
MSSSESQGDNRSIKIGEDVKSSTVISGDSNVGVQGDNAIITITNYYYREDTKVVTVKSSDADDKDIPCPYRGLFHFGPDDAKFFYGREVFVEELFEATQTRNFIPVLGASGSGKSSVVLAGLVPRLQKEGQWKFTHFRPGSDPFHALALALVPLYTSNLNATERIAQARQLAGYFSNNTILIPDVFAQIEQNHPNYRVLLIVDQFEEIYTLCSDEKIRRSFLDTLLAATQYFSDNPPLSHILVATMRTDFLGNTLSYPPFADVLRSADIKIRSMKRSELVQVIEKPAHSLEVSFEAGLVERILNDVENQPGNLPLLEFALTELWKRQTGKQITHAAYEAIGEVQGALASYADKKYNSLSNIEQEQVHRIFIQLVRPGEGTDDTRRLAIKAELGGTSWNLVTKLADARLVVTSQNATAQETVEVVHEALIHNWGTLRQWMAIDRNFRAWQERLRVAMQQWDSSGRDEGALLRGKPLADAEDWLQRRPADLTVEQEYIQASLALQNREHKEREQRRKKTIIGLVGGLVGALVLAGGAFWQWHQAEISRINAELNNLSTNSEALFTSNQEFEALIESIRAARQLKQAFGINPETRMRVLLALQQSVYGVKERNRFAGSRVSLNPNGNMLALVGSERTIELLNFDGRKIRTIKEDNKGKFLDVSFSPDGKMLASFNNDIVKLWSIDGTLLKTFKTEEKVIPFGQIRVDWGVQDTKVSFSPNGKMLASSHSDGTVKLWSIDGTLLKTFENRSDSQAERVKTYLSFSSDSKMLVVVSSSGKVILWNTNGTSLKTIKNRNSEDLPDYFNVSFSPDGKKIALVKINTVELIDLDGREIKTLDAGLTGGSDSGSVSFSPDGKLLAAATGGNSVKLWNLENEESETFMGFTSSNIDVSFSADGKTLAVSDVFGDTVKLFSVDSKKPVIIKEHEDYVRFISISPDGKMITTSGFMGSVKLWGRNGVPLKNLKNRTPKKLEDYEDYNDHPTALSFSPDGKIIALASNDGYVKLWNTNGTLLKTFNNETFNNETVLKEILKAEVFGKNKAYLKKFEKFFEVSKDTKVPFTDLSFSPDSKIFASASNRTIKLWSIDSGEIKTFKRNDDVGESVSFSPDGRTLAAAGRSVVNIFSREGSLLKTFDLKYPHVRSVKFSPDGKTIAIASWDNTVKILDTNSREIKILKGHNDRVENVNFSSDGQFIVSVSADGTAKFWSINGRELKTFKTNIATLSPDGKILALGSTDGTVILKSFDIDELLNLGCNWLHDYLKNSSKVSESDKGLCDGIASRK